MTPSLRGPVLTKITPQTGSSFHEKSQVADNRPAISQVMLSVNTGNEQALAFYRSCGFQATGAVLDGRIGPEMIMASDIATLLLK